VQVEASILVDAPRDEVFEILTDYGGDVRLRINPVLKSQTVLSREGNAVLCENVWERDGKTVRQQRRYRLFPPDRIEEEVVGVTDGMTLVVTHLDSEGDQTRLTLESTYQLRGIWRFLGRYIQEKLQRDDEEFLESFKKRIEDEFVEDVES
jgi:carbon monoxide dehydrogenase subunit G